MSEETENFIRSKFLIEEDIDRAIEWVKDNPDSTKNKLKRDLYPKFGSPFGFPPTKYQDDPESWWPEHWHWFCQKFTPEFFDECKSEISGDFPPGHRGY